MVALRVLGVAVLCAGLAGCSAVEEWKYRHGPAVDFSASEVRDALRLQREVMDEFIIGAGFRPGENLSRENWLQVTRTGMNYVSGVCEAYLSELVKIQLTKDRANSALDSTALTANAIVGAATGATSGATIVYLTQAFGFTKAMYNVSLNGYLLSSNASLISKKVREMMGKYEDDPAVERVSSRPESYAIIRGYFSLCLPATIEANLLSAAASAPVKKSGEAETAITNFSLSREATRPGGTRTMSTKPKIMLGY